MNYINDTYSLKYYYQFTNQRNELVRLEIHQKGTVGDTFPKEIGEMRDLYLNVVGNSADVFAPIIKTELVFSMLDTWDIPTIDEANAVKHGSWEEFYTPDSTAYLVLVKTSQPGGSTLETRWSGYITPDSWQESLRYHGLVTITARDNIGHLQDFQFNMAGDESGTVTVRQMITAAMQKIALPMDMVFNDTETGDIEVLRASGTTDGPLDLRVNTSVFKDDDWLSVLSDMLEAIGYVMRYQDGNKVVVCQLRNLQACGTTSLTPGHTEIEFMEGTRTLDPAYKDITEDVDFDPKDKIELDPTAGAAYTYGYSSSYTAYMMKLDGTSLADTTGPLQEVVSGGPHWTGTQAQRRAFLDPSRYAVSDYAQRSEGDDLLDAMFLVANVPHNAINAVWKHYMAEASGKVTFKFKEKPACIDGNNKIDLGAARLYKVWYQLSFITNGVTYYMNSHTFGGYYWDTLGAETIEQEITGNNYEFAAQFLRQGSMSDGYLVVTIVGLQYRCTGSSYSGNGVYARLTDIVFEPWTTNGEVKSDTVHTVNNAAYNVRCSRSPQVGFLSVERTPSLPGFYERALFCEDTSDKIIPAPYKWKWSDENDYLAFPVQVHKQLLCFYHETTEVLEGDCHPTIDSLSARFDKLLLYSGREHLILGGTLNFTTGRFQTLRMRSFFTWAELWGGGSQSSIAVVPTAADLTQNTSVNVRIDCNGGWNIRTLPTGLTASANSGTGTSYVSITRNQSFAGGTVVFETADGEATAELVLTRQTAGELSLVSVGADIEEMDDPEVHGVYAVEISFDPDDEVCVFLTFPSWIHFDDSDAESGVVYTPGVYYLWHDAGTSSQLPRHGDIEATGAASGDSVSITARQID